MLKEQSVSLLREKYFWSVILGLLVCKFEFFLIDCPYVKCQNSIMHGKGSTKKGSWNSRIIIYVLVHKLYLFLFSPDP